MQQLRKLSLLLPAALFITTPHVHSMHYVQAMYNWIQEEKQQLHQAIEKGDIERVRKLINNGAYVNALYGTYLNALYGYGKTPLQISAEKGHLEITQLLIDSGANVNIHSNHIGKTPLHYATEKGHLEITQLLIDNDANVNMHSNCIGETPLHYATKKGYLEIAQLLIDNGANVNMHSNCIGETPLHIAAHIFRNTEIIQLLVDNDADVNAQDTFERTPLHRAAERGETETAQLLIKNGANVNAQNTNRETPLHVADKRGDLYVDNSFNVIPLLINNGADLNIHDTFEKTPLHVAAEKGYLKIAQLLIRNGADFHMPVRYNNPPYQLPQSQGYTDITKLCDRIRDLQNNNIDTMRVNNPSREDAIYYAQAMIAHGYCDIAYRIISENLSTLSDDEYADIMVHAIRHRNNQTVRNQSITDNNKLIGYLRTAYEDTDKAQAVIIKVGHNVQAGYESTDVITWGLHNYENQCRNFCDDDGNTIAHLSISAQFNDLLPYIMMLVMQNENHNQRNKDDKTPVMLRREIGNHAGADIIKNTIAQRTATRGYLKHVPPQHTRIASQLSYFINNPHDYRSSIIARPQRHRISLADLNKDTRNHIFEYISGK